MARLDAPLNRRRRLIKLHQVTESEKIPKLMNKAVTIRKTALLVLKLSEIAQLFKSNELAQAHVDT